VPDDDVFDVGRGKVDGVEGERPAPIGGGASRAISGDGGLDLGARRTATEILRRAIGPSPATTSSWKPNSRRYRHITVRS
jgi:hypothetical protein